jgi:signal transduction histidine kinase
MKKTFAAFAAAALCATANLAGAAAEFGSAAEARAMLDKAVAAIKADKAGALKQFAQGENGFKDRDLYPFCGDTAGTFTAHPKLTGQSMKDLKGGDGDPIGQKIYAAAAEGQVKEVAYQWPRPGSTEPAPKVSLVTKVGDQVCAVGYYK